MTTPSSPTGRARRRTAPAAAVIGLVVLGSGLAACSSSTSSSATTTTATTPTAGASSSGSTTGTSARQVAALSSTLQGAEKATFKAVYTVTNSDNTTQTVTVEQAPPKSLLVVKSGSIIDTGTATYFCSDSGQSVCISAGSTNPLSSLSALFSPATALAGLQQGVAQADAHAAGATLTFSTGSTAGQKTKCATITSAGSTAKYCVTEQGVLAYVSANGNTFTMTSYSPSAPASDFALPSGATVETIPAGLPT